MQTKNEILQLLNAAQIHPDKRLGQHFLIDLNLMRMLVDSACICNNDVVLEVGYGTGSLTQSLCESAGGVIAVEVDVRLARIAKKQLSKNKNLQMINADILKNKNTLNAEVIREVRSACKKYPGRFLLVANLPYDAASALILNLALGPVAADGMYVIVQKEVAERMAARAPDKNYGSLSIYLSATGEVNIIRRLSPAVFWPQPQVESAMVKFVRDKKKIKQIKDMQLFGEVVNLFMQHRRKMLKASTKFSKSRLQSISGWTGLFAEAGINSRYRPEQIAAENYVALSNLCYDFLNKK